MVKIPFDGVGSRPVLILSERGPVEKKWGGGRDKSYKSKGGGKRRD